MVRRKQDNLTDILVLINGKIHPSTFPIIESQKIVIEFLNSRKNKSATRRELAKILNLNFSNLNVKQNKRDADKQKFYRILSPLFKTIIVNDRETLTYTLSEIKFQTWFDSLRRTGKDYFGG